MAKNLGGLNYPANFEQGGTNGTDPNTARDNLGVSTETLEKNANYTTNLADRGLVIRFVGAGGYTLGLAPVATLIDGWNVVVRNDSSTNLVIEPDGSEIIDGASNLILEVGQAIIIYSDDIEFFTLGQPAVPSGTGANTSLSNLSSVAINTSLVSDTDVTDDLGSLAIRWRDIFAQSLSTGDTNADSLKIRGYDVDGATFVDFITITAGNTPTCVLHGTVTCTTQTPLTNNTTLASTAYVDSAVTAAAGAPTTATYLLQTANGSLPNAQAMGALATGLVKNTTTTGVQTIAIAGTDYLAPAAIGVTVQGYDAGLAALAAFNTNGFVVQTANNVFAGRTATGTANEITVTNGDGVAGNPVWSLPAALTFTGKTVTGGTFNADAISSLVYNGAIVYGGVVTTADLTNPFYNDYTPTGFADCSILVLTSNTTQPSITGLTGGALGRKLTIMNDAASSQLVFLNNQDGLSSSANQFLFPNTVGLTAVLRPGESLDFIYNGSYWVWINQGFTPGLNTYYNDNQPADGSMAINALSYTVTAAQITANQNNYFPAAASGYESVWRLSSDASRDITGINAFQVGGMILILYNTGSFNIVLKDQNGSSTAANQFLFGADLTLTPNTTATIQYDTTTDRWRLIATTASAAASGANTALSNLASVAINTTLVSDTDITGDLGTQAIRWRNIYGQTIQTGDTAADTLQLGAWDVDGSVFVPFITFTANNTPTGVIASAMTCTTQAPLDASTKVASTAYVDAAVAAAAGSVDSVSKDINQSSHGFAVSDVIYHTGSAYAKASSSAASSADVIGIVKAVADVNNFTVVTHGYISTLSGLTADTTYFLSTTPGALTATEPSTAGQVSKPVLQSISATAGYLINYRGVVIGDITVGPVMISTQTVSGVSNVDFTSGLNSTYTKYKIEMTNVVPGTDNVNLLLRGSTNGGSSYLSTNEYYAGMSSINSGATAANTTNNGGTAITLNGSNTLDNSSGSSSCEVTLTISNLSSSAFYKHMMWQTAHSVSATNAANTIGSGFIATTSPVNALRLLASSGNLSGTFTLWGIR